MLKKLLLPTTLIFSLGLTACSMFTAWKSIPPPGGCDQCHSVELTANWQTRYQASDIADERGRLAFQTPQYNAPRREDQPASALELQKTEDSYCFECHKAPNETHKGRKGSYHHGH